MMFFGEEHKSRKPSLTPMIDVVFLLLVFFMLSAKFGSEQILNLTLGGGGGEYTGPPRLIEVDANRLFLNGVELPLSAIISRLEDMVETPENAIVLRGKNDVDTQAVVEMMSSLTQAGYTNLILVE